MFDKGPNSSLESNHVKFSKSLKYYTCGSFPYFVKLFAGTLIKDKLLNPFSLCDVILRVGGLLENVFDVILRRSSTFKFWLCV